jgi:NADH-quinone oxidoreductase subunit J
MSTAALLGGFAAGPVATALAETGRTSTAEAWLFWTVGPVMVLAALGLLFARRTIYAAMSVVLVMICLAILYVAQEAPFLGVVQVVVYTGAVMMLFLFVLMLVGVDASDSLTETIRGQRWIAVLLGIGLGITLVSVTLTATGFRPVGLAEANADSNPVAISRIIFGDFVFNLQAVGILLITAALGALVLTHKERLTRKVGQRERQEGRVAAGGVLTPLPSPGVYARSNAMDVPALGPDGRPLDHSVPRVLRVRGQERPVAEVHLDPAAAAGTGHVRDADEGLGEVEGSGSTPPQRSITGEEPIR